MKNSTFSAQVATNLLNVLQGYSKTIRLLLVMFLTLTVSANAWGATKTITITQTALELSDSYTSTSKAIDGVTFNWTDLMKNSSNIQAKASSGAIWNSSPIPGNIVSVAVTHSGTARSSTMYFGASAKSTTKSSIFSGTATTTPKGEYKYFYIKRSSNAAYWTNIVITYETSGGGNPVDPEVTFSNGEYTVGGAALDLTTLLTTNSNGAVTYSVKTDGGTGAIIEGSTFTATAAGTCTVQVSIAATATHNAATATANITVTVPATVEGTWTLVTNAANLKVGDEIVIASNTKGKVAAALTSDYLGECGVSFSNDNSTITALPATALVFTLGGSAGSWTLTNDGKSLGATAAKKLAWNNGTTTWSISIAESNATIQNTTDAYGRFLHNVQSTRFTTYTSNASASMLLPQIYKKAGGTPTYTITSTLSHVTAGVGNPTTITSEDKELTLSYSAESGWNLPENITITMGGNELTDSEYVWDNANGDLYIRPTSGFTGNIVVTINGWQQLATPTNLKVTNITSTSATLLWDAVANASSYTVVVYGENDEVIAEYPGLTETTKNVDGLSTKTNYIFGVVAVGDGITYTNSIQEASDVFTTDAATFTITYNTNGGNTIPPTSGTTLPNPLPTPTREHYTFAGWYTDESCTQAAEPGATITQNTTLYAKWEATMYTVTLNPNYPNGKTGVFTDKEGNIIPGNIEVSLQSGTASQALTNFYSSIELDNYAFDGFYTQANGGSKRVNTGDITGNITFFAHWKEKYTITWNVNSDTELISPTTFAEGDAWDMPTTDYDCSGKEFVGWTTNPIIAAQDEAPDPLYTNASQFPNATTTYYAVFAENTGGGGSGGYEKLTAALDDYSGEYLIVYEDGSVAFNGGLATLDATSNYISVTINNDVIVSNATTDAAKFTFAKVDGGYSILSASGKYIGREATSNGLNTNSTYAAGYLNTITYNSITGKGKCTLKYNDASDQKRFRYFASGQKAIALYKKSGSSATYTAYSTSCIPTYSITYDFAGGTSSHCSNTSVPQGDQYIICDEAPTREGYTFQGWSDGTNTHAAGATITPTKNITLTAVWQINTYTVTWSNNGTPTPVEYNHGDALVVPDAPASCDGVKEFVGWTTHSSYYHATTAPDDIFTTKTTPVTATVTYYAVFATPPGTGGGGGGSETIIDDVLTRETTGITDGTTTYSAWSGKTVTSSAIYAGNSAGGNNAIQLRSNNSTSGIVTTTSGGKVTHVEVEWQNATTTDRKLDIYGRNVAYSAATDLYNTSTQGTKLGSITCGTSIELEITDDYEYIGLRSNKGAMYLASVTITWSSAGGSSSHTDYTTTCQEVTGIALSGSYPTTFIQFDAFSFAGGIVTATLENGTKQDVTELATFSGYNMDEVGVQTVTVTYMGQTAKYEITINQSDRWRLTWNVSGKTNTGASPIYVQKGSAIGKLPTPEVPAACAGKTFMGWTTSNIVHSDGTGITYITPETVPTDNTTYYAVFATINNFCTQQPIDQITNGSKVVIVAVASLTDNGGAGKAISSRATDDTHNLQGDDVAIYDQTINTPHSTCIWTITKSGEKYIFTQDGQYLNGSIDNTYSNLKCNGTSDSWTLTPAESGMERTYNMKSTNASTEYVEWYNEKFTIHNEVNANGAFDMQFFVTANAAGNADTTDYTTGCAEYTITYYGFHGGYSTSCSSDGTIVLPVNSIHTIPNCEGLVINDHTNLGRTFTGVWMTKPHGGHTFNPGDTFILTQDTTLYAQWKMETTSDVTTLPTDIEDLAGTDIYVYGGKTLTLQPGTTTINSLTLKGGLQADGSYKMPTVWVPEGATLVRKSNKIYLDLVVNAQTYYPFAVPFAAKNNANVEYLDPELAAASTYGKHFVIKTYDGANRAKVGEDKTNNWVSVRRDSTLQPGVGYIITALTRPTEDTATIRIPMTVPDTWFNNGEQAAVGTTVRNTIAVTAHAGAAATKHPRHAGWNFVANPYLTNFAGGNVANDGGLDYIDGELIIEGSYEYGGDPVPYVTIPAYNFASYSQHKLSDVKLSPEYSFFVQVGTGGTMNFTTAGRQQAPASIAARNAEERPVKMDVDLILSDNHSSDQTGIIICDRYTDAYEIGHDLEKLFGSAYNLSVYTLMADNTPLAFQALAIRSSMQVIPVGYRAPEQGEYTFRLNEATSSIDLLNEQYEQLVLVDYQTGELTNLLIADYTFYSERTQSNARFAIYAVPRQNAPTDLPNAIGSDEEVRKVIYNDHLYILRDGNVYNGMGQKM